MCGNILTLILVTITGVCQSSTYLLISEVTKWLVQLHHCSECLYSTHAHISNEQPVNIVTIQKRDKLEQSTCTCM